MIALALPFAPARQIRVCHSIRPNGYPAVAALAPGELVQPGGSMDGTRPMVRAKCQEGNRALWPRSQFCSALAWSGVSPSQVHCTPTYAEDDTMRPT